jgi:hypothetical protein
VPGAIGGGFGEVGGVVVGGGVGSVVGGFLIVVGGVVVGGVVGCW